MNKIGLHMGYWWGTEIENDLDAMLDATHRAGLDALEINPAWVLKLTSAQRKDYAKKARNMEMIICVNGGLDASNDISSESEEIRKVGMQFSKDTLIGAHEIGSAIWSGVNYSAWLRRPDKDKHIQQRHTVRELSLHCMRELIKIAEDLGVTYCYEVVNRFDQFLFTTAREGVEYASELNSPYAKLLLDVFHMNIEEDDMCQAVEYACKKNMLGHLHVSESNRRVPTGKVTNIQWNRFSQTLVSSGYEGIWMMEPFVLAGAFNAYRMCTWRNLTQDTSLESLITDVREGGCFLREMISQAHDCKYRIVKAKEA